MRPYVLVALTSVALPLAAGSLLAQDSKPAPRAVERQAPPARSNGGGSGERAVPRMAAPRVESPRVESPRTTTSTSADSGRVRSSDDGEQARQRTAPPAERRGSGGGDRAVPRGSGSSGASGSGRGSGRGDSYVASPRATERDRGDRQSFGTATPRRYPPYPPHGGGGYYPGCCGSSWYYPYYPYLPLTYGLFWDPWWGYGYPSGGYGYGGGGGYGGGYGYGSGGGSGGGNTSTYGNTYEGPSSDAYGGLRLKVKPKSAQVYVDGQIAGVVDDFDSAFQQLKLDAGPHRIELRHPGFDSVSFDIRTEVDEKITYQAEMKPTP